MGLTPCLRHSPEYVNQSQSVLRARTHVYLLAEVTGGLNQMRLQIGNAVLIARILGVTLVVPFLEENSIWHDRR